MKNLMRNPSIRTLTHDKLSKLRSEVLTEVIAIKKMLVQFNEYLAQFVGEDYLETFDGLMENPKHRCVKKTETTEIFIMSDPDLRIVIEYKYGIIKKCYAEYGPLQPSSYSPSQMDDIKEFVINTLRERTDLTLTSLTQYEFFQQNCQGDQLWQLLMPDGRPTNIALLVDVTKDFCQAIEQLKKQKIVDFKPASYLVAMADGALYDLPIAEKKRVYKELHWFPTLLCKGPNFPKPPGS